MIVINWIKEKIAILIIFLTMICIANSAAVAQDVRLRAGDRIVMSVPERQELERRLTISEDGTVLIPVLGEIMIEGLLINEASQIILRRLQEIYPSVQGIELSLVGEEARRLIYVHGEVLNPGKYDFGENPNLWEAVREAGGANPDAALETVRIIRAEEEGRRTFIVNLQQVIENGNIESLPELRPGDTVIVPIRMLQYQGTGSVRVIGSVTNPGPYKLSGTKSLTDAILAAGGPTDQADLRKVKIIRYLPEGTVMTIQVDFADYLNTGDTRQNPTILPNDTVNIPRERNIFRVLFSDPRYLLGTLTASAAFIAVMNN